MSEGYSHSNDGDDDYNSRNRANDDERSNNRGDNRDRSSDRRGAGDKYGSRKRSSDRDQGDDRYSSKRFSNEPLPLLKVLIPNFAAGAIIGKRGANLAEMQRETGASIRISPSGEFYPNSNDRIVIITGKINQIVDVHDIIIDKVYTDATDTSRRDRDEEKGKRVVILCPDKTAGLIIGRGGADIKSLQEETKTKVIVCGRDDSPVFGERIIIITGDLEQRIEAARQVARKIAGDYENMKNTRLTYSDGPPSSGNGNLREGDHFLNSSHGKNSDQQQNNLLNNLGQDPLSLLSHLAGSSQLAGSGQLSNSVANLGSFAGLNATSHNLAANSSSTGQINTRVTIELEVPIAFVGFLLGNQGDTLREFMKFSGADIQFLSYNDFNPRSSDRVLTIKGNLSQTQTGYFLVNQKITQARTELGQSRRL